MENAAQYIKPNEIYQITQRPPVDEVRRIPLWLLIPLFLLIILGAYIVFNSLSLVEVGQTAYDVEGSVDYQVYLKENSYYEEKYLASGKQYLASLIDTVRADFDYQLTVDEHLDAHYSYEIIATAKATDRSDQSKVIFERSDTLAHGDIKSITNGALSLDESVNIDYGQYNSYMTNFRSDFGIVANCSLDVRMIVKVDGAIKTEDTMSLNIPLSNQTIDIAINTKGITRSEHLGDSHQRLEVTDLPLLIVGSILIVVSFIAGILLIYFYKTRFGNNWYAEAEHKIFKNYDTYIVNTSETFHEPEDVVRVASFAELLDAAQNEGAPILHYDIDPDYKSYFVVKGLNTTYRYTLTRAYQDELRLSKQGKEF